MLQGATIPAEGPKPSILDGAASERAVYRRPVNLRGGVRYWPATVEGFRDAALSGRICDLIVTKPGAKPAGGARVNMQVVATHLRAAAQAGRLIDVGDIPESVVRSEAARIGEIVAEGFVGQPFQEPWLVYAKVNGEPTVRLVLPAVDEGNKFAICDFLLVEVDGEKVLSVSDVAVFRPLRDGTASFDVDVNPSDARLADAERNGYDKKAAATQASAACLDLALFAIALLSTDGVEREIVKVSDKLAKARAKARKPPIPPHLRILSGPYVTAIEARSKRSERGDGHHASPRGHLRRGHVRHLSGGRKTWVRDCLVNITDPAEAARSHYVVNR